MVTSETHNSTAVTGNLACMGCLCQVTTLHGVGLDCRLTACLCCVQDFGEHGREFISSEIGLRLLRTLANSTQLQRFVGRGRRERRLQRILNKTLLKVRSCYCPVSGRSTGCLSLPAPANGCSKHELHWTGICTAMTTLVVALSLAATNTTRVCQCAKLHSFMLLFCSCQILPMENVHGRNLVEHGNLCERKNGRGVDTNRNWNIDWGRKEKDYDPSEEYPGTAPHRYSSILVSWRVGGAIVSDICFACGWVIFGC